MQTSWLAGVEGALALVTLMAAVFAAWRTSLAKALKDTCDSLQLEVDSLRRRLDVAETSVRMYRNQVKTLLELIREHHIVGAAKAADIIAEQLRQEDEQTARRPKAS